MHEMKMMERKYEPPSDWMHWEKQIYTSYDSFISEMMGLLQIQLMNTRPSLALGILALLILSVPTSTALVLFHFMQITMDVSSRANESAAEFQLLKAASDWTKESSFLHKPSTLSLSLSSINAWHEKGEEGSGLRHL
ncbi:hypothetical protein FH972_008581 [Carpinus fangiana]|uniref:Uncharacterized protein n=1 Tax=Carpinus fangiana TaxID=176857 RepID=A0A5N6R1G8_9ROSI|nr:hypothetical protein FH972_008581 [Carpinus fangiana]